MDARPFAPGATVQVKHRRLVERAFRGDRLHAGAVGQVNGYLGEAGREPARVLVRFPTRAATFYRPDELEPATRRP